MDGTAAISDNLESLKRILGGLFAMAGLPRLSSPLAGEDGSARRSGAEPTAEPGEGSGNHLTLPRHLRLAILRLLRPAESAARRLIIAAARGLVVALPPPRNTAPKPVDPAPMLRRFGIAVVLSSEDVGRAGFPKRPMALPPAPRRLALPLFDQPRRLALARSRPVPAHAAPRILSPGLAEPHRLPPPPSRDDPVDCTHLGLRLATLAAALDDLPAQARRYARWKAFNDRRREAGRRGRLSPLRPGRPPGGRLLRFDPAALRRGTIREVEEVLAHAPCAGALCLGVSRHVVTPKSHRCRKIAWHGNCRARLRALSVRMSGRLRLRVDKRASQTHLRHRTRNEREETMPSAKTAGQIRAGMGGWTFEPWDTSFYPEKLAKAKQLNFASRQVPTIEVNGTYYSTFKPPTFAKWAADAPDGFVFSLKAIRFATNRRVLAEAGESVQRFLGSGVSELGEKLGPILWQFAPTKKFDADDFGAFLKLLPEKQDGVKLRHAVEVRTDSFIVPEFVALCRKANVAIVYADHEKYPAISDVTGDFVYARLQTGSDDEPTCYAPKDMNAWVKRAKLWAEGKAPDDLRRADPASEAPVKPRDVFVYFITSGKVRAPHGAMAFMEAVGKQ